MENFDKFFRKFFQTTEIYGNYFQKGELGTQNQTKAMGSVWKRAGQQHIDQSADQSTAQSKVIVANKHFVAKHQRASKWSHTLHFPLTMA